MTDERRVRLGGLVWLLVVQYVVVELLAVAAWRGTSYSLTRDVVSDLGRPDCLPDGGCSPWSTAFNLSLGLHGVLVAVGALLLAPLLPRWRPLVVGLFAVTGAGNVMVGLFPLGQGVTDWHWVGASAAIGGATLAVGATGLATVRDPAWRGFAVPTLAVTLLGVLGLVLLATGGTTGLAERTAIYPVVAWYVVTGALVWRTGDLTGGPGPRRAHGARPRRRRRTASASPRAGSSSRRARPSARWAGPSA